VSKRKSAARRLRISKAIGRWCFILQRAIEIIPEATRRLPDELKATQPEIDWRSIAGIGNVLRHEYHTISNKVIWDVAQADLPGLKSAIEAIAAIEKKGASSEK
jgi:uncharacterized protein with HEPN domain